MGPRTRHDFVAHQVNRRACQASRSASDKMNDRRVGLIHNGDQNFRVGYNLRNNLVMCLGYPSRMGENYDGTWSVDELDYHWCMGNSSTLVQIAANFGEEGERRRKSGQVRTQRALESDLTLRWAVEMQDGGSFPSDQLCVYRVFQIQDTFD
jgi:hypothetical protein